MRACGWRNCTRTSRSSRPRTRSSARRWALPAALFVATFFSTTLSWTLRTPPVLDAPTTRDWIAALVAGSLARIVAAARRELEAEIHALAAEVRAWVREQMADHAVPKVVE